jgi:hypothetical protein
MSFSFSPKVVRDGLILYVDAANSDCYVTPNSTLNDLVSDDIGQINTVIYNTSNFGIFDFDGLSSDNNISLTERIPLLTLTQSSIDIWLNPSITSSQAGFFGSSIVIPNTTYYGLNLQLGTLVGNKFNMSCHAGDGLGFGSDNRRSLLTSSPVITANTWNHIAVTCDAPSLSNATFQLYVNGVIIPGFYNGSATQLNWGNLSGAITSLGRTWSNDSIKLTGYISNAKMYNKILTQNEILQNYNALKSRFGL